MIKKKSTFLQKIALTPNQWTTLALYCSRLGFATFMIITPFLIKHIYTLPFEATQGIHVRMLFLHVPCAFCSMTFYSAIAAHCFIYLIWRLKVALYFAKSLLLPCLFLSAATLVTGSLWGAPTWGTWWIWDARLTSSLVLFLILLVLCILLHLPTAHHNKINRLYCIIALLGWIDLPLVHYSVEWFQTLHQGASLSLFKPSSIDSIYFTPLIIAIINLALWTMSCASYQFVLYQKSTR